MKLIDWEKNQELKQLLITCPLNIFPQHLNLCVAVQTSSEERESAFFSACSFPNSPLIRDGAMDLCWVTNETHYKSLEQNNNVFAWACVYVWAYTYAYVSTEYSVTLNIKGRLCSTVGNLWLTLSVPFLLWLIYSFSTLTPSCHPHPGSISLCHTVENLYHSSAFLL